MKNNTAHVDPGVSLKGLDMSFKLDGLYAPEKNININMDYQTVSKRLVELRAQRHAFIESMEEERNKDHASEN